VDTIHSKRGCKVHVGTVITRPDYVRKNKIVNFYWAGFWAFLMMISAVAGAMNTLMLLDIPAEQTATIYLSILTMCFVIFVMFGWFRLSAKAIANGVMRGWNKLKTL